MKFNLKKGKRRLIVGETLRVLALRAKYRPAGCVSIIVSYESVRERTGASTRVVLGHVAFSRCLYGRRGPF